MDSSLKSYNTKELGEQIEEMQSDISEQIESINFGGCVHFAHYFSKKLEELGVPYEICYASTWNDMSKAESCSHVMVEIPEIGFVDGIEIADKEAMEKEYKSHIYSGDSTDKVRNMSGWNKEYDRNQNIHLEQLINKHIK